MNDTAALARELEARYGFPFENIEFLRESGAICYTAVGAGEKLLVRRAKPAFREGALRSARVLALLEETGFPAPRVVRTAAAELTCESGGALTVVLRYIEGREPKKGEALRKFGELAGRLHAWTPADGLPARDEAFYVGRYLAALAKKGYPDQKLAFFREYGAWLWARVEGLPTGFCHGDMHRGNALIGPRGEPYLLDFDAACLGYPGFDAAVYCDETDYFRFRPSALEATLRAADRFYAGYAKHRAPSAAERESLPLWIALRHFEVQATILDLFGLDCVDEAFVDRQREWLSRWRDQCAARGMV